MRIAAYVRVSTQRQAETQTIEQQIDQRQLEFRPTTIKIPGLRASDTLFPIWQRVEKGDGDRPANEEANEADAT